MVMPADTPAWLRHVLEDLAGAQERTEERLDRLAAAQERTEERLERLAAAQEEMAVQLDRHGHQLDRHGDQLGMLTGWAWEARFRDHAPSYLGQVGVRGLQV